MMRLADPYVLLLLPLLLVWLLIRQRRQRPSVVAYSSTRAFGDIAPSLMTRVQRFLPLLRLLSLGLCTVALARPQQGLQSTRVYSEGIAIVMVVWQNYHRKKAEPQPTRISEYGRPIRVEH